MVSWNELQRSIAANPDSRASLAQLKIPNTMPGIDMYPLPTASPAPTPAPSVVAAAPKPVTAPAPAPVAIPAPPQPVAVAAAAPAAAVAVPIARPARTQSGQGDPVTQHKEVDPIVFGIEEREPLYADAPACTRQQMEREEAIRIESLLSDLYKTQNGRSRGWVKSSIEPILKPRCASGGAIHELVKSKQTFIWQLVREDKALSAFLDYLCVAKQIRLAVWFPDEKQIYLFPAADYTAVIPSETAPTYPLYHVTCTGHKRIGLRTCADLLRFCETQKYALIPPLSVLHSLQKLTLDELESVGKKLGMDAVTGKKEERVAAVAVYKLKQRLQT